MSMILTANYN